MEPNPRSRAFTANFNDLSGPTNPTGILSPAFLRLKLALDHGDKPENVLQALYDWLSQKKILPAQVDAILDLPSSEHACEALLELVNGKMIHRHLPEVAKQTLKRAIQLIAQRHVGAKTKDIEAETQRLSGIQGRFGMESATRIVNKMLNG